MAARQMGHLSCSAIQGFASDLVGGLAVLTCSRSHSYPHPPEQTSASQHRALHASHSSQERTTHSMPTNTNRMYRSPTDGFEIELIQNLADERNTLT